MSKNYSCNALGVCQCRAIPCLDCPELHVTAPPLPAGLPKYPFAPGVIDNGEADDGQYMGRNLLIALVAVAAAGLLGGCVIGFCKSVGWLP